MAQQVFPTKANLISTKKSLNLAKLGYDLMDRKRNILVREMMLLIDEASELQNNVSATYERAYAALKKAYITLGNCHDFAENVPVDNSLSVDYRSVMGVELPIVSVSEDESNAYYGLENTNSMLDEAFLRFKEVKAMTVRLAEIENSVYRLADAISKTQKRANALDNIMIPQFESTVKFISDALEEKEREDFSRLKVTKKQKESTK
ncbi:MAG: V-type ATP synthase subunit D [Acutalibacteraceae bacterium]